METNKRESKNRPLTRWESNWLFVGLLSVLIGPLVVIGLLFLLTRPSPAHGQTLAIGELVNHDQHILLTGANRDGGIALWEHGLESFDVSITGLHSLAGPRWWGVGVGIGAQLLRSPVANIATYPSLLVFNGGWDTSILSGLTIASRVLWKSPLIMGYAGANPSFGIKARTWSLDALPVGVMLGSWHDAYLFLEYDIRTKLPAIGIMRAINNGTPR